MKVIPQEAAGVIESKRALVLLADVHRAHSNGDSSQAYDIGGVVFVIADGRHAERLRRAVRSSDVAEVQIVKPETVAALREGVEAE